MRRIVLFVFLLLWFATTLSANGDPKHISAHRINESIKVDGVLDEISWTYAEIATDFTQRQPSPGKAPSRKTEVKVLYTDEGIFVGAKMYDEYDNISKQLFERDNLNDNVESDWFGFGLDTYMDGINGNVFLVTPAGVQVDIKFTADGEDGAWDAVWNSAVTIVDDGWVVEMEIPYSALRFPDKDIQEWHVQFGRKRFITQEEGFWNEISPEIDGFFNQAGILYGIKNIKSPFRLSATPFIAVYGNNYRDKTESPQSSWGKSINGGMDVRYGISDAFTLDLTLIPDFGQVQSDNEVLNLTPFEIRFDENRQFFTEGTELFGKANLFYSRRVGGVPLYHDDMEDGLREGETMLNNPTETQLYNALKVSGRTSKGTGLGIFNAISAEEHAVIENEDGSTRKVLTSPFSNYNVLVIDQNLKNNSYVSLINTNVWRAGSHYNANVTGTEFDIRDKDNRYSFNGDAAVSQKYYVDSSEIGTNYSLEFGKRSGNLLWEIGQSLVTDTYDPNDMGFLQNNNEIRYKGFVEYNWYKPFGRFIRMEAGMFTHLNYLYKYQGTKEQQFRNNLFTEYGMSIWWNSTTKNFFNSNFRIYFRPVTGYDYFEPRVDGRFFERPSFANLQLSLSTDTRKKFILSTRMRFNFINEPNRNLMGILIEPQYRFSDKFTLGYGIDVTYDKNAAGYVEDFSYDDIVFGRRNVSNVVQLINANYVFKPGMNITFRLRHNWTRVKYNSFHQLLENGQLRNSDYNENQDINFNAFSIDAVYRWRFAPGSDIFIVWKTNILGSTETSEYNYWENFAQLREQPRNISLSIKFLYYLDFYRLTRKNK